MQWTDAGESNLALNVTSGGNNVNQLTKFRDRGFFTPSPLEFLWSIAVRFPIGWTPATDTTDTETSLFVRPSVRSFVCLLDGVWHLSGTDLTLPFRFLCRSFYLFISDFRYWLYMRQTTKLASHPPPIHYTDFCHRLKTYLFQKTYLSHQSLPDILFRLFI